MKLDLPTHVVDQLLLIVQESNRPGWFTNPLVQALVKSANDPETQALEDPKPYQQLLKTLADKAIREEGEAWTIFLDEAEYAQMIDYPKEPKK